MLGPVSLQSTTAGAIRFAEPRYLHLAPRQFTIQHAHLQQLATPLAANAFAYIKCSGIMHSPFAIPRVEDTLESEDGLAYARINLDESLQKYIHLC